MAQPLDPLILDLVEWIAAEPRTYLDVMDAWRTNCPRLTVWEDALERGYVSRRPGAHGGFVAVTSAGVSFLAQNGRYRPTQPLHGAA
jgi:hypothetical protein